MEPVVALLGPIQVAQLQFGRGASASYWLLLLCGRAPGSCTRFDIDSVQPSMTMQVVVASPKIRQGAQQGRP